MLAIAIALLVWAAWLFEGRLVRMDQALALAVKQERIDELDAFAGRVAHDLKGILAAPVMAASRIRRSAMLDARALELLAVVERGHRRMTAIIDGLLAFARAGASASGVAAVDHVVADVAPGLVALALEEAADLGFDLEPGLRVAASPAVLASIIENLARNAILYLGDSELRRVTIRARGERDEVVLDVEDSGPGIPADVLARLFRPFERGSSRPGTGLGLATVKRLAEASGGSVSVRSLVGTGSAFSVRLPRAPA